MHAYGNATPGAATSVAKRPVTGVLLRGVVVWRIVVVVVAQLVVGSDHGRESVAVGVRRVGVTGADGIPVGGGDLGGAGAALQSQHRVGVGLTGVHGRRRARSGAWVGLSWLTAV